MKPSILLSSVILGCLASAGTPWVLGAEPSPIVAPAPANTAAFVKAWVDAIAQTTEPSAAVQMYAAAMTAFPDNSEIARSYVRRLVEFGLPEMASAQARHLIDQNQADGLCWAVAGYMSGKRDEPTTALVEIEGAVVALPDHPFVQRTAGQLVAWYDTRANWRTMPDEVKAAVVSIKNKLARAPTYDEAYRQASAAYVQMASGTTGAEGKVPAAGGPATPPAKTSSVVPATTLPAVPDGAGSGLTSPYYPSYYYPYNYVWTTPVVPDYYTWWPSYFSVVVVDQGRFFQHHHHEPDGADIGRSF
ncbi:MAG: hypothetical protein WCI73_15820, partial [Phycisphaerae bacterium]